MARRSYMFLLQINNYRALRFICRSLNESSNIMFMQSNFSCDRYIKLQACIHKVPVSSSERGSQWPEKWPARLTNVPYWLSSSQVGVYGKPAPEDFAADDKHWKNVVSKSYLNGMGIQWTNVRNVMDMNSIYGG